MKHVCIGTLLAFLILAPASAKPDIVSIVVSGHLQGANHAELDGTVGPYTFNSVTPDYSNPVLTCNQGSLCSFGIFDPAYAYPFFSSVTGPGITYGVLFGGLSLAGSFTAPTGSPGTQIDVGAIPVTFTGTLAMDNWVFGYGVTDSAATFTISGTGTMDFQGDVFAGVDTFFHADFTGSGTATGSIPTPEPETWITLLLGMGLVTCATQVMAPQGADHG